MYVCYKRERVISESPALHFNWGNSARRRRLQQKISWPSRLGVSIWACSPYRGKMYSTKKPNASLGNRIGLNEKRQTHRKRIMNFGTLNTQGCRGKLPEIAQELEKYQFNVVALTETKKKGNGSETIGNYIHLYSGVPKHQHAQRGVSILVEKKLKNRITDWEAIDENIIRVNMNILQHKLSIFGIYAISNDATVADKDLFFEKLNREISRIGNTREIIILGDLNARTGRRTNHNIVGPFGEETINDNGERLIDLCEQYELEITNGYFKHKDAHRYTWSQSTRNLKSIIDYAISKQNSKLKTEDVRVYRGICNISDHHLLKARIFFPVQHVNQHQKKKNAQNVHQKNILEEKYNIDSLQNDSTKYLYQKRLDSYLEEIENHTTTEIYENIVYSIKKAAKEALGIEERLKSNKYWWNLEIEELVNEKKKLYQKWLNTKKEEDHVRFKEKKRETRRKIAEQKRNTWDTKCKEIDTYIGGRKCSESWKFINRVKTDEKTSSPLQLIPTEEWIRHYKNLLTEHRPEYIQRSPTEVQIEGESIDIDKNLVEKTIKQLKNGKSAGPGGIKAELLKCGTDKLYKSLAYIFTKCINGQDIPEDWKTAYITSIHKKGNKLNCKNYRGISVTSSISRVYGRILRDLIEAEYRNYEEEEQCGFRAGRSCTDNVFCLKQLIEKKLERNRATHLLFIDLQKAYDNIPIKKLWEVLQNTNINHTVVKAVQALYNDMKSAVKIGSKITDPFIVDKGLRQGCCISPTLFKIYVAKALERWKKKCGGMGIQIDDNTCLYTLQFADDQVVCANDKEDLEYMTRKLKEEYELWGLQMNIEKTQYLCIGEETTEIELDNNETIKTCEEYTYLGVNFNKEGTDDNEIKLKINKARRITKALNGILWSTEIGKERKKRIYECMIKSTLLYGAETWRIKEHIKRKIEATEMDALRRSSRTSRLERVENERIKQQMNVRETVMESIEKKQLVWYGHVQRMGEERLPRKLLKWIPPENRRRGRPRKSWIEGIRRSMSDRGLSDENCNDRRHWHLRIGQRRRTL